MRKAIHDQTQWPDHVQKHLAEAEAFREEVIADGSLGGGVCVYISKAENIKAYLSCKRDDNGHVGPLFYETEPLISKKTRGDAILATMQAARPYRDETKVHYRTEFNCAHAIIERLDADGYIKEPEAAK